jgi:hypothetical protein
VKSQLSGVHVFGILIQPVKICYFRKVSQKMYDMSMVICHMAVLSATMSSASFVLAHAGAITLQAN